MRKLLAILAILIAAVAMSVSAASAAVPTAKSAPKTTWVADQGSGGCVCARVYVPVGRVCLGGKEYILYEIKDSLGRVVGHELWPTGHICS